MEYILIFKTSIQDEKQLFSIRGVLNQVFGEKNWTLALDDFDKVLRVVSSIVCTDLVVKILNERGFQCEELPYDLG